MGKYLLAMVGLLLINCSSYQKNKDSIDSEWSSYGESRNRSPAALKKYSLKYGDCGGLKRVPIKTPQNICVGLVSTGFISPRSIEKVIDPNNPNRPSFIMTDHGGWGVRRGAVYLLQEPINGKGEYIKKSFFKGKLRMPSGIKFRDGFVYVGEPSRIFRFNPFPKNGRSVESTIKNIITDLPGDNKHLFKNKKVRHPLTVMDFDEVGNLYVNIGSASDNCRLDRGKFECKEAEGRNARGVIRKYFFENGEYKKWKVVARGLRNSMSMVINGRNLIQGENSRDGLKKGPAEEINIIKLGMRSTSHFGWPYCQDNNKNSPEFKKYNCRKETAPPHLLLPAHSSPLGMNYYTKEMFPKEYQGNLMLTWHGPSSKGRRLVFYKTDADGIPFGKPKSLLFDWKRSSIAPEGAPFGVTESIDGSVFLTEDKNRSVLRVIYGDNIKELKIGGHSSRKKECLLPERREASYKKIQKVFQSRCLKCHRSAKQHPEFLSDACNYNDANNLLDVINGDNGRKEMPPIGNIELTSKERRLIEDWVAENTRDAIRIKYAKVNDSLNIRKVVNGKSVKVCGELARNARVRVIERKEANLPYVKIELIYKQSEVSASCGRDLYVHGNYLANEDLNLDPDDH